MGNFEKDARDYWARVRLEEGEEVNRDEERQRVEAQELGLVPDVGLVTVAAGNCKTCGCPPDQMPMVNRGGDWCSENCRKEQQGE